MATATINISVPDTMKADVEEIVRTEGYGNTSEFFRDLVREFMNDRQRKRLRALVIEGLESGPATPVTKATFDEIRRRGIEQLKHKSTK